MSRRDQGIFGDIVDLSSKIPFWTGILLAVFSYFILHQFADITPGKLRDFNGFGDYVVKQLFKTLAYFFQYILPVAFSLGAVLSIVKTMRRFGFFVAFKSLVIGVFLSSMVVILLLSWRPELSREISNSIIVQKAIKLFPTHGENPPVVIDQGTRKDKDYVFSEEDISIAKQKLLKEKQANSLFEIQLNSGRSLLAKNVTIKGEIVSFENENGLVMSMQHSDIKGVKELLHK